MYSDPVFWSLHERIARYREQADVFNVLANSDDRPFARNLLRQLAVEFGRLANCLQELP